MTNPIEWMNAYAKWNEEAQQELIKFGYTATKNAKGEILVYYSFAEDGTVFKTVNGSKGKNEFQSGTTKNKVTPWKESKHYIEM